MKHFFKVKTVEEVLAVISSFQALGVEDVPLVEARARVLAEPATSGEDIPQFDRSTMDGFAVRAKDTFGATEGLPALFNVIGEVQMGTRTGLETGPGQTARVWTGCMIPKGADSVVMVEHARPVDERTVELAKAVAPYDNVIRVGEDVRKGQTLLSAGHRLRAQDVGLLAALGHNSLRAYKIPRVAIISTGDEIVPTETKPKIGQVRDINSYSLGAQVEDVHATPVYLGLIKDNLEELKQAVGKGLEQADSVILSGGSSVGIRDYTVDAFTSFPGSEILVHGVSVSPGKPTILSKLGNKSLWGLPGHAVSAMITFDLFLRPLLETLSGEIKEKPRFGSRLPAVLSRNVPSVHGREDYIRVRIQLEPDGRITAHPVLGKSGLISTMVKADGLVRIGLNEEGLVEGSEVTVLLF